MSGISGRSYNAAEGIDYILHQAALPSVQRSIINPLTTTEVNINGTLNILEAARFHKVQTGGLRLVVVDLRRHAHAAQGRKYAAAAALAVCHHQARRRGILYFLQSHLRPRGRPACAISTSSAPTRTRPASTRRLYPKFITSLIEDKSPVVFGDGEQSRDFTYIDNVVEANILACTKKDAVGRVMNIACGQRYSLNDMIKKLQMYTRQADRAHLLSRQTGRCQAFTGHDRPGHAPYRLPRSRRFRPGSAEDGRLVQAEAQFIAVIIRR